MFLVIIFLLGMNNSQSRATEGMTLVKHREIYLFRPGIIPEPISAVFTPVPLYSQLPAGEIFMVERGIDKKGKKGAAFFFASDGYPERIAHLLPPGATGAPGNMSGVLRTFTTTQNEFGSYDISHRLNFFNSNGGLTRSVIIPPQSGAIFSLDFNNNRLAMGLVEYDLQTLIGKAKFLFFNYPLVAEPIIIALDKEIYGIPGGCTFRGTDMFLSPHVTVLSSGVVVCNLSNYSEVYCFSNNGEYVVQKLVPPHFKSFEEAEPLPGNELKRDEEGHYIVEIEEWLTTWTHSYPAYELSSDKFLIPRVLFPVYYLDLYLYSNDTIEYLGYVSTDKQFLFADSTGVFLLEEKDAAKVVVGKYELVTADELPRTGGVIEIDSLPEGTVKGIRRVEPDTADPCEECPREKYKPKGYSKKITRIKLLSTDSTEYLLIDSLASEKGHVLLFGTPQDCVTPRAYDAALKYIDENPEYDLVGVYSHPYKEELAGFIEIAQTQMDCTLLANIDRDRLRPILKHNICFLVVSEKGKILATAEYPDFEPKPREEK